MLEVDILSGARVARAQLTIKDRFVMYIGNELNSTRASIVRYLWLLEDRRINDVTFNFYFFMVWNKQIPCCGVSVQWQITEDVKMFLTKSWGTFSTLRIFHTTRFPHPTFSTLRTPRFPPNQILTSSVIYYRTDARQHGINLLIWSKLTAKTENSLYYGKCLFLNTTKSNAKPMLQPDLDYKYNHA